MNLAIIVLSIAAAGMWLAWSFERQKNEILSKEIDEIEKLTSTDEKENPVEPVLTDLRLILVAKRFIHMFLEVKRLKKELYYKNKAIEVLKEELRVINENDNFNGE